ncbi:LacI family DNA-binding transcriptional regulator [Fictibacillus phosphorivorans]|uniref:LacI family DNA-binding transcriptional regulator n=1 Tax=Fictibacillus phosphorivorans TaxID=1221500 RepID=UPI002041912A|nr:LacI family DNA-binding transcriptional regulator [Fictibacillus phosphorivorans]MCM3718872.1 LacI family transcriptional regulator [Fictibacillus phosphorivorans]MCM3776494.1 LacI family transcriptional regulator [Fictibacillus phosphorivorans]
MVTIADVAKQAGVSKGTVSSVFSKKRPISAEVTERVLNVAKELNYVPNHAARSLATKKNMIIGLKMPTLDTELSSFDLKVINGVVKKCTEIGYRVLLDRVYDGEDTALFSRDPVDGVILLNPKEQDPRIVQYKQLNLPYVLIGRPNNEDVETKYVDNNNIEIVKEVGEFLIESGHKDILFLNASYGMTVAEDRKEGFRRAFENFGLHFLEENVIYNDQEKYKNGSDYGFYTLIETVKEKKYTAIIADTDRVALGVLRAARELGMDIPNDLSLVALSNNETLALETTPQLTSIELFPEKLGEEAAEILINVLNDQLAPRHKMIPAKLVVRDSCRKTHLIR